ncbi:MAG: hypothetical protein HYZ18_04030 [Pseudogulbenkiania sp.]|nr:hypothetical protein [Pseudogulbenkiania sp.]
MTASACHRVIDVVWRIESAKIIASVARRVRDVSLAEARAEFGRAAALTRNTRERELLLERTRGCKVGLSASAAKNASAAVRWADRCMRSQLLLEHRANECSAPTRGGR